MSSSPAPEDLQAFEAFPFDFVAYLARRVGTDSATARHDLGRWLESSARKQGRDRARPAGSGVFDCPDAHQPRGQDQSNAA